MKGQGVLVLGGGVAGAAVATLLARTGERVTLLEQYAEPRHKMCGEFLSTEACESLRVIGIEVRELGAAPVRLLRFAGRRGYAEHPLPFAAWSLTRRRLDEAMLAMAERSGARVMRGVRVEALEPGEEGPRWWVRGSDGETAAADEVFVASGKHDLRGHARPEVGRGSVIAFKQYFRLCERQAAELEGAIELLLFRGGYAGLQRVEDGSANLTLVVEGRRYREAGGSWEALLGAMVTESQLLRRRLSGAEAVMRRPLSLARIPYGYLRRAEGEAGLWHLGDQAAVIPSFSGDGMSIALHTARVAAEVYLGGGQSGEFRRRVEAELGGLMRRATAISPLLLRRPGQSAAWAAVRMFPGLLPRAAAVTRIPAWARARLGGEGDAGRA